MASAAGALLLLLLLLLLFALALVSNTAASAAARLMEAATGMVVEGKVKASEFLAEAAFAAANVYE